MLLGGSVLIKYEIAIILTEQFSSPLFGILSLKQWAATRLVLINKSNGRPGETGCTLCCSLLEGMDAQLPTMWPRIMRAELSF